MQLRDRRTALRCLRLTALFSALLFLLLLPPSGEAAKDGGGKQGAQGKHDDRATALSEPLSINKEVHLQLNAIHHLPNADGGETFAFILQLQNASGEVFDFFPYWLRLELDGKRMPIAMIQPDRTRVLPGMTTDFVFYATLPAADVKDRLKLRLIRWDMGQPDFERTLGEIPIRWEAVQAVESAPQQKIPLTDGAVQAAFARRFEQVRGERKTLAFDLTLENIGKTARKLPDLRYFLITDDGAAYPLLADEETKNRGEDATLLLPRLPVRLTYAADVPAEASVAQPSIAVLYHDGGTEGSEGKDVPIAVFRNIPKSSTETRDASEERSLFDPVIVDGPRGARAQLVFDGFPARIPDGREDVITARFSVSNTGEGAIELSAWQGELKDGSGTAFPVVVAPEEEKPALYPGQRLYYTLNVRVPYDWTITQATLNLTPNTDTERPANIPSKGTLPWPTLHYRLYNDSLLLSTVVDGKQTIQHRGQALTFKTIERRVETHLQDDLVTTLLEVANLTPRPLALPTFRAYYWTDDGRLYPALVEALRSKGDEAESAANVLAAKGTVTLAAKARLPEGEAANLRLVVAIENAAQSTAKDGGASAALLRAVAQFSVPLSLGEGTPRLRLNERYIWKGRAGAEATLTFVDAARLPRGSGDILSFVFDVENSGRYPFATAPWRGELRLSDGKRYRTDIAPEKDRARLEPGERLRYIANIRLDRDTKTAGAVFVLMPESLPLPNDAVPWPTIAYTADRDERDVDIVSVGSRATVEVDEQKITGVVRERRTYYGDDYDIVSTVVEWTNDGQDIIRLPQWNASYIDRDRRFYPAKASASDVELLPGGKIVVEYYGHLPEGDMTGLTLLLSNEKTLGSPDSGQSTVIAPIVRFAVPDRDDRADPAQDGIGLDQILSEPDGKRGTFAVDLYPRTVTVSIDVYQDNDSYIIINGTYTTRSEKGILSSGKHHAIDIEWLDPKDDRILGTTRIELASGKPSGSLKELKVNEKDIRLRVVDVFQGDQGEEARRTPISAVHFQR
ncbi:MAG: hypothetical protein IMW86_01850 [Hydrogenibacillus sp.]|nr:hypothetical protein [Hydrogenibacillus sp.]